MGWRPSGKYTPSAETIGTAGFAAVFSLTTNARNAIIPLFHHSIIPGWNMQNGGVEISYYQQFVEFPIYLIINF